MSTSYKVRSLFLLLLSREYRRLHDEKTTATRTCLTVIPVPSITERLAPPPEAKFSSSAIQPYSLRFALSGHKFFLFFFYISAEYGSYTGIFRVRAHKTPVARAPNHRGHVISEGTARVYNPAYSMPFVSIENKHKTRLTLPDR